MHITPEQVSNIQKIAQAGVPNIAELSPTYRKTLLISLKILSKEAPSGVFQKDLKSLPQEIKMLGKKIEDIKVGLSYVEDHNIPVTEANLKFLESIQGKNLEESQQLFQERIEALDREIHDMPTKEGVF